MSSAQSHLEPKHEIKLSDAASVVQPAGSESKKVTAMTAEMGKTGIDVVGDMPWGTHFCLFYETLTDLLEPLVLYCKAGLESREFCLWVVAAPLTEEDATHALKQAVPDLDRYLDDHSIEIAIGREYTVAPVEALAQMTESLDPAEAAPLMCAGVITFNSLYVF